MNYLKIVDDILHQILKGNLKPGDKLMTEVEMIDHYSVSKMTTRKAIAKLEYLGAIDRIERKGAFVKLQNKNLVSISSVSLGYNLRAILKGYTPGVYTLNFNKNDCSSDEILKSIDNPILLERVRTLDKVPAAHDKNYISKNFFDLLDFDINSESLFDAISQKEFELDCTFNNYEAVLPNEDTAKILNIECNEPVFEIRQIFEVKGISVLYIISYQKGNMILI